MNSSFRALCIPVLAFAIFGGVPVATSRAEDDASEEAPAPGQADVTDEERASEEVQQPTAVEPDADADEEAREAPATDEGEEEASDRSESPEAEKPEGDDEGEDHAGDPEMDRLHAADEEMETTTSGLVEKHKSASTPDDREAARSELLEAVNRHFDVRQLIRARELAELEKQIAELRQSLERRTAIRDKIVQRRMTDLLGDEAEDLDF